MNHSLALLYLAHLWLGSSYSFADSNAEPLDQALQRLDLPQLEKPKDFHESQLSSPLFELGKRLFYSKQLSFNGDVACVSCHHPQLGGGDDLSLPVGVDAKVSELLGPGRELYNSNLAANVPRNSPTTFNIHFYKQNNFWDGRIELHDEGLITPDSIHLTPDLAVGSDLVAAQSRFPITSTSEMFGTSLGHALSNQDKRSQLLKKFIQQSPAALSQWLALFAAAFPQIEITGNESKQALITLDHITQALSVFQRSQIFIDNPWFAYLSGKQDAISQQQKRGAKLFYTGIEQGGFACSSCHSSGNFSDEKFHNLAMPQFGIGKSSSGDDIGRSLHSRLQQDKFKFRTPSLLNTEVTGPWGHTGAYLSLADVIKHHISPVAALETFDFSLSNNPQFTAVKSDENKNRFNSQKALQLIEKQYFYPTDMTINEQQLNELVSFLTALTDPCVKNENCLSPWLIQAVKKGDDTQQLDLIHAQFSQFPAVKKTAKAHTKTSTVTEETVKTKQASSAQKASTEYGFVDISQQAGFAYDLAEKGGNTREYMSGGVAVDDFNNDGWLDVFVSHALHPGKLFINQQGQAFKDVTKSMLGKLTSNQFSSLFLDIDSDGFKDLIMVNTSAADRFVAVYKNLNGLRFRKLPRAAGLNFVQAANSISAADIDGDQDLDLFFSQWSTPIDSGNFGYLWSNSNKAKFSNLVGSINSLKRSDFVDLKGKRLSFTSAFSDFDNDSDADLLIAGDFATSQILLKNNQGRWQDKPAQSISDENGMGMALGDYDNDGDLDWFVSSIWNPLPTKAYVGGGTGNRFYRNEGKGDISDITDLANVREGYWGWGACFADFNNDGWLDLFHTNGMRDNTVEGISVFDQFLQDPSRLYINNQDGSFSEQSAELGMDHVGQGRGISCLDYDNDGDIDILIANNGQAPSLYQNNLKKQGNYLAVKLKGHAKNPDAVGAKVYLTSAGSTQYRELRLGSNYQSNNPVIAHFGLGEQTQVDELKIIWPDKKIQILPVSKVNQYLYLEQ